MFVWGYLSQRLYGTEVFYFNFSAWKDTVNRMKRQPIEWNKIFANHISERQLISRIYKEPLQLHKKQQKSKSRSKWTRDLNRHFSKEDVQVTNEQMKRCSTSLITGEMQDKSTMGYHFTSLECLQGETPSPWNLFIKIVYLFYMFKLVTFKVLSIWCNTPKETFFPLLKTVLNSSILMPFSAAVIFYFPFSA